MPVNYAFENTWCYSTFMSLVNPSITMEVKECKKISALGRHKVAHR